MKIPGFNRRDAGETPAVRYPRRLLAFSVFSGLFGLIALVGCEHSHHEQHKEETLTTSSASPQSDTTYADSATAASTANSTTTTSPAPTSSPTAASRIYQSDDKRRLFAQIVEDYDPQSFEESAILEGAPYKYLLHECAQHDQDALRKIADEKITFDNIMQQPGLYRGTVVTLARGVVLEAAKVALPDEFGLPGYSVMLAVFVDAGRDVWALRVLLPPGSKVYDKVQEGIRKDSLPVCRAVGYFMKIYARNTAKPGEPPWRRPLLICPELEFSKIADPRHVHDDLVESHADELLPSKRFDAPDAEERLVVEVSNSKSGVQFQVENKTAGADINAFIADAVEKFKKRLPGDQVDKPAAVILIVGDVSKTNSDAAVAALRAAGVQRLAIKREAAIRY